MAKKPTRSATTPKAAPRPRAAAKPAAAAKPRPRAKAPAAPAVAGHGKPADAKPKLEPVVLLNHDQIARRAYDVWVARGYPAGQDVENWQEAERQLKSELARG